VNSVVYRRGQATSHAAGAPSDDEWRYTGTANRRMSSTAPA
jgi:hypothetical protein